MTAACVWNASNAAAAAGGGGPTVSMTANGQANSSQFINPVYAGQQFNTSGSEFECSAAGSYNQSLGAWLDTGSSSDVWVERFTTSGSWNNVDPGTGRHQLSTTRSFRVSRSIIGTTSVTGYFRMYDAASGGNTLQTTSSATWSAERDFDPCPLCCFTPDTLITMADGLPMQIGKVKAGDLIRVEYGIEPVGEVLVRTRRPMYKLHFSDDRVLRLSADHPIHVEHRGYCCVEPPPEYKDISDIKKLKVGDNVTTVAGDTVRIEEIEGITYPDEVYTFSNSRFYANGLLVY